MRRSSSSRSEAARAAFTWGVFAFVVARAVVVWRPLREGSVNPYVFLALDLATAYPYARAWPELIAGLHARQAPRIAYWSMVLTGSVVAPYVYVAIVGDDVAPWVWMVFVVFAVLAVTLAAVRASREFGRGERSGGTHPG